MKQLEKISILVALFALVVPASAGDSNPCEWEWDPTFGQPGLDGNGIPQVTTMTVYDDGSGSALYVGGRFTSAGGVETNHVAKWDGEDWISLGGDFSWPGAPIQTMATFTGTQGTHLYVGGNFSMGATGDNVARYRFDTQTWSGFGGGVGPWNSGVGAMEVFNEKLYIGGGFTTVGSDESFSGHIASWTGSNWGTFSSTYPDGSVNALKAFDDGECDCLYIGGNFSWLNVSFNPDVHVSNIVKYCPGSCSGGEWSWWHKMGEGLDAKVNALEVFDDGSGPSLYAGGHFGIAKWNGVTWTDVGGGLSGVVWALTVFDDGTGPALYAGGSFSGGVMKWDGNQWSSLLLSESGGGSNSVRALAYFDDGAGSALYAGGLFTSAGGHESNLIAKWTCRQMHWSAGTGVFNDPANWIPQAVPSPTTDAVFDGSAVLLPDAYNVNFTDHADARRLMARTDHVTLNLLGKSFTLHQPSSDDIPSLLIGTYPDEDARLIFRNLLPPMSVLDTATISIGDAPQSMGRLTFRDSSFRAETYGNVHVGRRGLGHLIVEQNGEFRYGTAGSRLEIGAESGSSGTFRIQSGGTALTMASLDTLSIGRDEGSVGEAIVSGGGSSWTNVGDEFIVGNAGNGKLSIENGGSLVSQSLIQVILAKEPGSTADVKVVGAGSYWIEAATAITIGAGEASIEVIDGGIIEGLNIHNFANGTISGDGFIFSDVFNLGTVIPGAAPTLAGGDSTGTLTIQGNYRQIGPPPGGSLDESGQLHVRVGADGSDRLHVTGNAELGGGLFVELMDGFDPELDQQFEVLTAGSVDPQHDRFDVAFMPGLPAIERQQRFMRLDYPEGGLAGGGGVAGGPPGSGPGVVVTVDLLGALVGFDNPFEEAVAGSPTAIAVGNFDDGNDSDDLAIALEGTPGSVIVLYNDGFGNFTSQQTINVGDLPRAIAMGDFTGDGRLDLAVANSGSNSVSILMNNGSGFAPAVDVAVGSVPRDVVAGEFREKGVFDLAVANAGDDTVHILHNDGGSFSFGSAISNLDTPVSLAAGDMNGDDVVDLVLGNFGEGTQDNPGSAQPILNSGDGTFVSGAAIEAGQGVFQVSIEDIDNTKDNDIIVVSAGSLGIVRSLSGGAFAPAVLLPLQGEPGQMTAFDMDGDRDVDVALVINDPENGPFVRLLRNDTTASGSVVFAHAEDVAQGLGATLLAHGDITGDGDDDLITIGEQTSEGGLAGGGAGSANVFVHANSQGKPNQPDCPGDLSPPGGDQSVGVPDLLALLACWGEVDAGGACAAADLNGNGNVGVPDLLELLAAWGTCP